MTNPRIINNFSFVFLALMSCNEHTTKRGYQVYVVNKYLEGQMIYEYYEDSIVKVVSEVNHQGQKHGRTLEFTPDGVLKRLFFINNDVDTVGDDSRFNSGQLYEHYFRLDTDVTLFYARFSKNGKLILSHGRPFYIYGNSDVRKGDTIEFYIASPIIPGFQTKMGFGQDKVDKSLVNYINNIRQFTYRKVMPNKGQYEFYLQIQIKDSLENVIIEDLDTFEISVN